MIEIRRVDDIKLAKKICSENNLNWNEKDHVIATLDGETVLQCAVFTYSGEVGEIKLISGFNENLDLLDGLCRAILNIMDINRVKEVYLSKKYVKIAEKVGFQIQNGQYHLKLEGFFHCGCCKK